MSKVDSITVILGPPAEQDKKDELGALAEASGESVQDAYIGRIAGIVNDLTGRPDGGVSHLDKMLSALLGQEVVVDEAVPTYYEKKENRYPAIMIPAASVTDIEGAPMIDVITSVFQRPETPSKLAEKLGRHLNLESARVFFTFGASRQN